MRLKVETYGRALKGSGEDGEHEGRKKEDLVSVHGGGLGYTASMAMEKVLMLFNNDGALQAWVDVLMEREVGQWCTFRSSPSIVIAAWHISSVLTPTPQ